MSARNIKPMVFYFEFNLSLDTGEDQLITKAFAVTQDGMEKVLKDHKIKADKEFNASGDQRCTAFNYFVTYEYSDDITAVIEDKYGVHDWSTSPSDDVDAIGYHSYEINPDKVDAVMQKHRAYFVKHAKKNNVTDIVELDSTLLPSASDSDIFQMVMDKIAVDSGQS